MAITVYKNTDRLTLKIGEVEFKIKPLTFQEKMECMSFMDLQSGKLTENNARAMVTAFKYSIKDIKGVEDSSGDKFELDFDENGNVTEDCVSSLLNTEISAAMMLAAANIIKGYTGKLTDPETGKEIKGVEFIKPKKSQSSKSKAKGN